MTEVTALFWDVGGVLGTNGWDASARTQAVAKFDLVAAELEARHAKAVVDFERGRLSLDHYLARVVFYRRRAFTREAFKAFMFSCSRPNPETLALARALAESGRYLMATVNNESLELNLHRIERFGLRRCFAVFFSSCFLGVTKPDPEVLRKALLLTQRRPEETLFIDDRPANVEAARRLGMRAIRFRSPEHLRDAFRRLGLQLSRTKRSPRAVAHRPRRVNHG